MEGTAVGEVVVNLDDGRTVGDTEGLLEVGLVVGLAVGAMVDGFAVGTGDDNEDGAFDGPTDGLIEGNFVHGRAVGETVVGANGVILGRFEGFNVGNLDDGRADGDGDDTPTPSLFTHLYTAVVLDWIVSVIVYVLLPELGPVNVVTDAALLAFWLKLLTGTLATEVYLYNLYCVPLTRLLTVTVSTSWLDAGRVSELLWISGNSSFLSAVTCTGRSTSVAPFFTPVRAIP